MVSFTRSLRVSITLSVSLPALATTSQRPLGDNAIAEACSPVRTSDFGLRTSDFPAAWPRSITDTEPSLAIKRTGSTRTSVPFPAGPVTLFVSGRRPPQLLT